jgi:Arc/MetJ-type ribon-helix-helix transcriptional regulator
MSPNKDRAVTVRLDRDIAEAMDDMQARYGTPFSEQIRRALTEWLAKEGFMKADRPRVGSTRKRS